MSNQCTVGFRELTLRRERRMCANLWLGVHRLESTHYSNSSNGNNAPNPEFIERSLHAGLAALQTPTYTYCAWDHCRLASFSPLS